MIDLALWLDRLDGENPSGEDLRNDPRFHELERLLEPQVKVEYDERNRPSSPVTVPVDWGSVLVKAEELRACGRDLRLLVIVTCALTNEEGLAGLARGLTLIAQTFDMHWETMHPALRPGAPPREAALRRINALRDLQNDRKINAPEDRPGDRMDGRIGLLASLRQMTFFAPRQIGPITGNDLEQGALDVRTMLLEAPGLSATEKTSRTAAHEQLLARIRSACLAQLDQANEAMTSLMADARAAIAALEMVDTALSAHLGDQGQDGGTAVPELKRFLDRVLTTLERGAAARNTANGAVRPATSETAALNGHHVETTAGLAGPGAPLPDRISSREDVVKCLDLVVAFYDRTEPSSPIPHLARRIRRMVPMDFIELMEDLAPSGLKEFRLLAGVPDTKKTAQKDER